MKKILIALSTSILFMVLFTGCNVGGGSLTSESDTVKWINTTYAILTTVNGDSVDLFGGVTKNKANEKLIQDSLEEWWGVTDRTSAEEMIEFLMEEGHRAAYAEEMMLLEEDGMFDVPRQEAREYLEYLGFEPEEASAYIVAMDAYETYGASAIDAWDYTRALHLLSWYYVADYYTKEEALDQSLEIAKELQTLYNSWEEMVESYLVGHTYWILEDPNDSSSQTFGRRQVYKELKESEDNPYTLNWNMTLEKTW